MSQRSQGEGLLVPLVENAVELPQPHAACDVLTQWLGVAEENAAGFSEQAIREAERGDIDAALYASSAAEFAYLVAETLRAWHAEVIALIVAIALMGLRGPSEIAAAFLL